MMQQFDPRRPAFRLAPRLLLGVAGLAAVALGWQFTAAGVRLPGAIGPLDPATFARLQHQAFAETEAQPGLAPAQSINVKVQSGETFEAAVRRIGIAPEEASRAVSMLSQAFDIVNIKAGLELTAAVAKPRDERGPVRLIGLSLKTGPASTVSLSRTFDGALRLREMEEKIVDETKATCGAISGSLYVSAMKMGATPTQVKEINDLFAHKVDFQRDMQPGDEVCVVFDRKVTESGQTVEGGSVRYAELKAKKTGATPLRFYRYMVAGATKAQYLDENGKNIRGLLLRTPVEAARITSSFGSRRHPILGYTRMHTGVDFGASSGTPVYAAGDGVVVEVRRNGGYGNWVKIRHSNGWETGYAHLSRWAKGLKSGMRVSQGQLIAYVGSTGQSTGPHLHYEVMKGGKKVNPKGVSVPSGVALAGAELAQFNTEKARMDGMVATAELALHPAPMIAIAAAPALVTR